MTVDVDRQRVNAPGLFIIYATDGEHCSPSVAMQASRCSEASSSHFSKNLRCPHFAPSLGWMCRPSHPILSHLFPPFRQSNPSLYRPGMTMHPFPSPPTSYIFVAPHFLHAYGRPYLIVPIPAALDPFPTSLKPSNLSNKRALSTPSLPVRLSPSLSRTKHAPCRTIIDRDPDHTRHDTFPLSPSTDPIATSLDFSKLFLSYNCFS